MNSTVIIQSSQLKFFLEPSTNSYD